MAGGEGAGSGVIVRALGYAFCIVTTIFMLPIAAYQDWLDQRWG